MTLRQTESMRLGVILAAIIGLTIATLVVGYIGFAAVFQALAIIGWRGLAFLSVYSAAPLILLGSAWFVLDKAAPMRQWGAFVWARVVRDAGTELLPFSHLGGFVIGARAAILRGVAPTAAYATTIVDVTAEIIAQLGFTGLGLALLMQRLGESSSHNGLVVAVVVGMGLSVLGAIGFIGLQRRGVHLIERLAERFVPAAAGGAGLVGRALHTLYDNPLRIVAAVGAHFAAWIASAVGAWLALRLAGVDISLQSMLAIESLVGAVRSVGFLAPMGIGVQEGAYALIGPLFGLGAELSLALSLLKRARDVVVGVPTLLIWQAQEGVRLVGRRPAD